MMKLSNRGFTLPELMLAVFVLLIAILGLLASYISCIALGMTAKNITVALNGAKAKIEEIRNSSFYTVVGDYSLGGAQGDSFHINNWPEAAGHCGAVEIVDPDPTNPNPGVKLNTSSTANPGLNLYEVRVTVSWREKGNRIIGEDRNFNGQLDIGLGEDTTANGQLDSPVKIVTLIAKKP